MASTIEEYQKDIEKYNNLKEQIGKIIARLDSTTTRLSSLNLEVKATYKVDGDYAAVTSRIASLKTQIESTSKFLKETLKPDIVSAIDDANNAIDSIKEQQRLAEEEHIRREAEAAAAQTVVPQTTTQESQSPTNDRAIRRRYRQEGAGGLTR